MPFVVISDPVEAHRYRQAGMLWYSGGMAPWVALSAPHDKTVDVGEQAFRMSEPGRRYAILVEEGDELVEEDDSLTEENK
jgi:hypothetical protein